MSNQSNWQVLPKLGLTVAALALVAGCQGGNAADSAGPLPAAESQRGSAEGHIHLGGDGHDHDHAHEHGRDHHHCHGAGCQHLHGG